MQTRQLATAALAGVALLAGHTASATAVVTPVTECRILSSPGVFYVYYGYVNTDAPVAIDFGTANQMLPGFGYQGQPTVFNTGSYPRVVRALFNTGVWNAVAWDLNGTQAIATVATTPLCTAGATGPASDLAPTGARLHGLVESENTNTAYHFEYGPTIQYGSDTVEQQFTDPRSRLVDEPITGLAPGTTYHYRLVSSGAVTTVGDDHTFTTPAAPNPPTDLTLTQSSSPTSVRMGEGVASTLTVSNAGPVDASGVQVVDALPAGADFDAAASSPSCAVAGSTVTCAVGDLASGAQASATVAWIARRAGTATNAAIATGNQPDPATLNNRADNDVTVTPPDTVPAPPAGGGGEKPPPVDTPSVLADLVLKRSGARTVRKGKRVSLKQTITNRGPVAASGVTLVERLPSGVRLVSATWPGGKCSGKARLTCRIGAIPSGGSVKVTIKVLARRTGRFSDTASVAGTQPDPRAADNVAIGTLRVR